MFKRKGFTLIEMMIALAILGILTALVLPMINNNSPSRNRMMMKKAYYAIEDVVRTLISDEQHYPELGSDGNTYEGFDNTLNTCGATACSGLSKFAKLFANQLNLKDDVTEISDGLYFETNDGMCWEISGMNNPPAVVTSAGDSGITQVITVDVNCDKKPNSLQGLTSPSAASNISEYDRFKVYVTRHGKIVPESGQTWFEDAISIDSDVSGD